MMVYVSYKANTYTGSHPIPLVLSYAVTLHVGRERKAIDQFTAMPETKCREVMAEAKARAKRLGYKYVKWEE